MALGSGRRMPASRAHRRREARERVLRADAETEMELSCSPLAEISGSEDFRRLATMMGTATGRDGATFVHDFVQPQAFDKYSSTVRAVCGGIAGQAVHVGRGSCVI